MSLPASIIAGHEFNDTPQPMSMQGMSGWWSLPRQWFARPIVGTANLEASPNADFSPPLYVCTLGDDEITYVFQDLLKNRMEGIS